MKFNIPPDQNGYSVQDPDDVLSVKLDGGLSRTRKIIDNATSLVTVTWTLEVTDYEYLRNFYLVNKALPFEIDLLLDTYVLTEHTCKFVPNTMKLTNQSGLTFVCSATLEVKPLVFDLAYIESQLMIVGEYGSEAAAIEIINQLNQLANVDFPDYFG